MKKLGTSDLELALDISIGGYLHLVQLDGALLGA